MSINVYYDKDADLSLIQSNKVAIDFETSGLVEADLPDIGRMDGGGAVTEICVWGFRRVHLDDQVVTGQ